MVAIVVIVNPADVGILSYVSTLIAVSKRIHKSSQGNMWMVEDSKQGSFYRVMYDEDLQGFVCDCKAFTCILLLLFSHEIWL
jgi:hypothetical protein